MRPQPLRRRPTNGRGLTPSRAGCCWLAAFLPMLDTSIVNLALPQLAHAFGVAPTDLGWVTNAYLLPFVVMITVM